MLFIGKNLFWDCPFAVKCWDLICPQRASNLNVFQRLDDMRGKITYSWFMEIIMITSWSIWVVRNNVIFNNKRPSVQDWKFTFKSEMALLAHRIKKKHLDSFNEWRSNLD
jgi:hypothetical protein